MWLAVPLPPWSPDAAWDGWAGQPGLTLAGSLSCPSGTAAPFILAILCSVASAAPVFPVDTLYRADSGMNWKQSRKPFCTSLVLLTASHHAQEPAQVGTGHSIGWSSLLPALSPAMPWGTLCAPAPQGLALPNKPIC